MSGPFDNALHRFQYYVLNKTEHVPHDWLSPTYITARSTLIPDSNVYIRSKLGILQEYNTSSTPLLNYIGIVDPAVLKIINGL